MLLLCLIYKIPLRIYDLLIGAVSCCVMCCLFVGNTPRIVAEAGVGSFRVGRIILRYLYGDKVLKEDDKIRISLIIRLLKLIA